jgi:TonB family protein
VRKSRPAYFRAVPYAVAVVTAFLLWVALSGLGRYLAGNTSHTAVAAANKSQAAVELPQAPDSGLKAPNRSMATPAKAARRAPKMASGMVSIVRGARPVTQTQIPYSPDALREGVSGTVELQITIAADGSVQSPQVLSGDPLLTRDVAEAISNWTFQSMRVNGRPVPRTTEITLRFDIVK